MGKLGSCGETASKRILCTIPSSHSPLSSHGSPIVYSACRVRRHRLGYKSTTGLTSGIDRPQQNPKGKVREKGDFFSITQAKRASARLLEEPSAPRTEGNGVLVVLTNGFVSPLSPHPSPLLVITNAEIFAATATARVPSSRGRRHPGDSRHPPVGLRSSTSITASGRYKGLELLHAVGATMRSTSTRIRERDRLYVPLYDFKQVQKYAAPRGFARLSSLDTSAWSASSARKENILELARTCQVMRPRAASQAPYPG